LKPVNQVVQPLLMAAVAVTAVATSIFGTIEVSDTAALWSALAKMGYDNFQPFNELIDNAIAAIIAAIIKRGTIYIDFNFTTNIGSIEHSGGTTFPHDLAKLQNCFIWGLKNPTTLNEHGCGLKQSLALLNPENNAWQIWIKYVDEIGTLKIIKLQAPFTNKLQITTETDWPGQNTSIEPGSYIQFPLKKEKFSQLYKKDAKMSDNNDLHKRIVNQFSHTWMKQDEIMDGSIQLIYNTKRIIPFAFTNPDVFECVESTNKIEFKLSTGAKIQIEEIKLNKDRPISSSNTFKATMAATGVYIYKNGRFIESINSDQATRKLYSAIFNTVPDHHQNGYIKIINMIGSQDTLPPTVPTKNRFGDTPLFDEFINELRARLTPLPKRDQPISEESMVAIYSQTNESTMKMMGINVIFDREKTYKITDSVSTPPIDLVITTPHTNTIKIMEFKTNTKPMLEYYEQLHFNWLMAKESPATEGKELIPILVLSPAEVFVMPEQHKEYLRILAKTSGFYPIIQDTKNTSLYKVQQ
jgi:hypothetical protein